MPVLTLSVFFAMTASLLTMVWAERLAEPATLLSGFLALQLSHNDGIAFGLGVPSPWQERIIVLAIFAVVTLAYFDRESLNKQFSYGLILGGALANLVDRVIDGFVTDIFRVGAFPIFNAADTMISIGVGLLILDLLFDE